MRSDVALALIALSLCACETPSQPGAGDPQAEAASPASAAASASPAGIPGPVGVAPPPASGNPIVLETSPSAAAAIAPPAAAGERPKSMPASASGVLEPGKADAILKTGAPPKLTLIGAGAEPRAKVAYDFTIGDKQRLGMGLTMQLQMRVPGKPLPATDIPKITMLFDLEAKAKRPTGEFDVLGVVDGIEFGARDAQQQAAIDQMKSQLDGVKGLTMTYSVSPSGRVRDVNVKLPGGAEGNASQTLGQMTQSFESMVAPLPDEAIGVGARWEVVTRVSATGADMLQWATYELVSRDDNRVTLKLSVAQLAADPKIQAPGMPPGMSARLVKLSSSGEGKSILDLADVAPVGGGLTLNTSMEIEMSHETAMPVASGSQRMSFDTRVKMDFERPSAPPKTP